MVYVYRLGKNGVFFKREESRASFGEKRRVRFIPSPSHPEKSSSGLGSVRGERFSWELIHVAANDPVLDLVNDCS